MMIPSISIAQTADAPLLNKLVNAAYRGDTSRKGWTTEADLLDGTRIDEEALRELLQQPNTTVLKYEEGNDVMGCVELRREKDKLYLGMLSVQPNTQGKGIGKKLLLAAEEFAQEKKCPKIFMTVISVRKELIDWYIRHGYRLTGERKPFIVPDTRWGIPKQNLEFVVLEKSILITDLRYLQAGQQIKITQTFKDFDNYDVNKGSTWTFRSYNYFPYDGGYTFMFEEGTIRLAEIKDSNLDVIYNGQNYFTLIHQ